jgi:hypothetical protein
MTHYRPFHEYRTAWSDLHEILSHGSNDPNIAQLVANLAIHVCLHLERSDGLETIMPVLLPLKHHLLASYQIRAVLGRLELKRRRWYSAYRHLTLALELFEASPEIFRARQKGYWHFHFTRRARAAVAMGWLDKAEADIAESRSIANDRPPGYFAPYPLALAKASLACAQHRFSDARFFLQQADAQPSEFPRLPDAEVDFLLIAARIARAEGNMQSFGHFCQRALVYCTERDMRLTKASVQAAMNGAEY